MVEELKDLIKNQSNLKSYKTVPFPAVWSGFITELSQKGTVQPSPPYGQLVYHISASSISPIKATGVGDSETFLDMCIYDLDGRKFSAFGGVPSGPACSPVGIAPLWLGAFGERACLRDVGLLVVSGFAGGKSFAGGELFEFCW